MRRILLAIGTRPEAIKTYKLVEELRRRRSFEILVVSTGQHRDMLDAELSGLMLTPDIDLGIMSVGQTLFEITERVMRGMRSVIEKLKPDILLVHGDTATAFASALAAFYLKVPVGHIEAGLRTYDRESPYPEEFFRRAIAPIAEYHFAQSAEAFENLAREGIPRDKIFLTGNTVIDALRANLRSDFSHPLLDGFESFRTVIFTAHRRECSESELRGILRAAARVISEVEDARLIYPVHKNPAIRRIANEELSGRARIVLCEPIPSVDFHNILARCYMILTDSGGIQEEAAYLGKPTLVMRNDTERREVLHSGCVRLVGVGEDAVYRAFKALMENRELYRKMAIPSDASGDGCASVRIADALEN